MHEVSVRELRNSGGQILDRVEGGEAVTITRDGRPVARLAPLPKPRLSAQALFEVWRTVPGMGDDALRSDLEQVMHLDL